MARTETLADITRAYLLSGQTEELARAIGKRSEFSGSASVGDAIALSKRRAASIHSATKMVLSTDFVRTAFDLGQQHPDILLQFLEYARMPFGSIWLEWRDREARGEPRLGETGHMSHAESIGVLLRRVEEADQVERISAEVFTDANSTRPGSISLSVVGAQFLLGPGWLPLPPHSDLLREATGISGAGRLNLGGADPVHEVLKYIPFYQSLDKATAAGDIDSVKVLQSRGVITMDTPIWPMMKFSWEKADDKERLAELIKNEMMAMAGIIGMLCATIALISMNGEKEMLRFDSIPRGAPVIRRGKPLPLYEYRMLTIVRPQKAVVQMAKRLARTGSADKRWHLVEGHWCYSRKKGDANCSHDYVRELDDEGKPVGRDRHVCKTCGAKKWRRKEFGRGNSLIGVIEKGYEVTTKPR